MGRIPAIMLAFVFAAAAAGAAWRAHAEFRGADASRALLRAEAAAGPELRDAALHDAGVALQGGRTTGWLRDLDARLRLLQIPADAAGAAESSRAALARSPAREESWARLAYLAALEHNALTGTGAAALSHSFIAAPFPSHDFQMWRIEFGLTYWPELNAELRSHIGRAVDGLPRNRAIRSELTALAERLENDEARDFLLQRLDRQAG